ncbi:hypothetical protein THSYN_32150 (plasmid) [Candidatus Thiodictyon syntrophicum]|uniref:Uncharacterized protein n=1 Tax=Candidatus Thiodictyon syntrophicum TaxID=1166950 RepID=A0A2K8UJ62_9GAMM|nr:hypothetical protein THSYN_32150 [Candidatus Thiodictyon syntrophicum]
MAQKNQDLSSRQLLDLIGLSDAAPLDLLGDEPLDGLTGRLRHPAALGAPRHRREPSGRPRPAAGPAR